MKRLLALALLASCSTTAEPDEQCKQVPRSIVTHQVAAVVPGRDVIGVSWAETTGTNGPIHHAALVFPDGTRSDDTFVLDTQTSGTAGTSSVLWYMHASTHFDTFPPRPFTAVLQRDDAVLHVDITTTNTFTRSVVFDGQRYHLFWVDEGAPRRAHHRTLEEDGTLGPERQLAHEAFVAYISAATDPTGAIFLRVEETGYLVDGATSALTKIWPGTNTDRNHGGPSFYFDGYWYVNQTFMLKRIDVATHEVSIVSLQGVQTFHPAETSLYVRTRDGGLFELGRDLQIVEQLFTLGAFGTFAGDRVLLEPHALDPETLAPGYIDLSRGNAWRTLLATDSPVAVVEDCEVSDD